MIDQNRFMRSAISIYKVSPDYNTVREIEICEPCNFTIEVLVPYELDCYIYRGIQCEIWTNACDIYSSTGRWHSIRANKIALQKKEEGRIHLFDVSILPIMCGHFEYTIRICAPKSPDPQWKWYDHYNHNGQVNVIRNVCISMFSLYNDIRQFWQWFQDACGLLNYTNTRSSSTSFSRKNTNPIYYTNMIAYISAYMTTNAYQNGVDLESCRLLLYRLTNNIWIKDYSNIRRLLVLFTGSSPRANFLERKLMDVIVPLTNTIHPLYYVNKIKTTLMNTKENPISSLYMNQESSHLYRCVPNVLLKLALLNKSTSTKCSLPNEVIFDLLLSYIKTAPNEEIDPNLPFELFTLLLDTNDILLYMYVSRLLKILYENTSTIIQNHKHIYISNYVISGLMNLLNLYTSLIQESSKRVYNQEVDDLMYVEGHNSPLHLILKFIRSIFIESFAQRPMLRPQRSIGRHTCVSQTSKTISITKDNQTITQVVQKSKSYSNIYELLSDPASLSNDMETDCNLGSTSKREASNRFLIFYQLIELFLCLKQDHPDYSDLSTLLYEFSQLDPYLQIYLVRRLLSCSFHNSEEQIAILKLLDHVLKLKNAILFSVDFSLQKIVSFYLKMLHSRHIILSLTALTLMEYRPNHYFWVLLTKMPTLYAHRFLNYLEDPFNQWTSIYTSAVQKFKDHLKEQQILINGVLNLDPVLASATNYSVFVSPPELQMDSSTPYKLSKSTSFNNSEELVPSNSSSLVLSDSEIYPEETTSFRPTKNMYSIKATTTQYSSSVTYF